MGTGTRRVRFDKFIDYIQENYRTRLNSIDYEFLQEIADNYTAEEIMNAISYCKEKKSDSLIYLQDALKNKYYQQEKTTSEEPKWFKEELKAEPLDEKDKEWARSYYKKYCDTEEEYHKRLKENELEE